MHTVILGAGVVGYQIAHQLISEGKDVIIIEKKYCVCCYGILFSLHYDSFFFTL